jgi:hypothetical protein
LFKPFSFTLIFGHEWIISRVHQGASRQGGANSENLKNLGGGSKLIGFNGQFFGEVPKILFKIFFSTKIIIF